MRIYSRILGTGSYLPANRLTNADLAAQLAQQGVETSDDWIVERTGIRARHFAADHQGSSDLATEAARKALSAAGISADDLDLIIVATSTPDMVFPSVATMVQHKLGTAGCPAFDVQAVCSGFIYALEVGGEPAERPGPTLPILGCGSVVVDHNYGGVDNLVYRDATGYSVVGANVYVFRKDIFDDAYPALPNRNLAIAGTTTRVNGRWTESLLLDPGDYAVIYEKPGEWGPDHDFITVVPSDAESSFTWVPNVALAAETSDAIPEADMVTESSEAVVTETEEKVRAPVDDDFWNF